MSGMETIDITNSPNKISNNVNCGEIETFKNVSSFYKKEKSSSKYPLQELEDNILNSYEKDTLCHPKQLQDKPKSTRKRKRRNKNSKVAKDTSLKSSNSENIEQENDKQSPIEVPDKKNNNKIPVFYGKLFERHDALKECVHKSRQAFSAYKVSTFFYFNSEFIKDYGDCMTKIEQAVKDMEFFLGKAVLKTMNKVTSPKLGSKKQTNDLPKEEAVRTGKKEACSIKALNSPIKAEISSSQPPLSQNSRKRKIIFPSPVLDKEKREKRMRKCTVRTPVAIIEATSTKTIVDYIATSEKNLKSAPDIENADDVSDSESTKEGEYEVRKIQDYVRRQGCYFYRVSWRGYDSDDDTFEPADHLDGCEDALTEFFYQRLKEREKVTTVEEFKNYSLPSDERRRELLYKAFERLGNSMSELSRVNGIKYVASCKTPAFRSKEGLQDEILKFLALKDPTVERYKKSYASIIEQISFKEIYQERLKQLADLRTWERSMNIICSDPAPLYVENYVDLALPPLDFIYINEYVPGPGIIIPNDPIVGCECKECTSLQKTCCPNLMNSHFSYNRYGRLRVSLGTPIYECNKACTCSADCLNRVVQNGRKVSLVIFRTSNDRGWGVKALEPIKKDQFVSEYVGEVISSDEAEQRGMKYDTKGCTYLFDLDYNKGDQNPYTVDAMKYGNVSHFINHSCDPNLVVYNVWVNCLDPDLPKLALFAARDIRKGEEVTFDYNSGSTRQISIMDKLDGMNEESFNVTPTKQRQDEDGSTIIPTTEFVRKTPRNRVLNAGKTECRCGAANCRSYFF